MNEQPPLETREKESPLTPEQFVEQTGVVGYDAEILTWALIHEPKKFVISQDSVSLTVALDDEIRWVALRGITELPDWLAARIEYLMIHHTPN